MPTGLELTPTISGAFRRTIGESIADLGVEKAVSLFRLQPPKRDLIVGLARPSNRDLRRMSVSVVACPVRRARRRFPVGASPTRHPLQPEATGAGMEVTKCLKPLDSGRDLVTVRVCRPQRE
jgi:hypothetical protein